MPMRRHACPPVRHGIACSYRDGWSPSDRECRRSDEPDFPTSGETYFLAFHPLFVCGPKQLAHASASFEQLTFRSAGSYAEEFSNIFVRVTFNVVQHQYLTHAFRQLLHRFFQFHAQQCFIRLRAHRHRFQHGCFMTHPALPPTSSMQRAVHCYAMQPGRETRIPSESAQRTEDSHPRFLRPILSQSLISSEALDDRVNAWRVHPVDLADRNRIAFLCPLD